MENNRLIAEFMGVEPTQISSSLWGLSNTPFWSVTGPTPEKVMQDATNLFGFEKDWNKLLKVVCRITELSKGGAATKMLKDLPNFSSDIYISTITDDINKAYQAVIEFITWYNSQTK